MPDAEIKRLMKDLEESINVALNDSEKINESIRSINDAGYDAFLVIEATIGYARKGKGENETVAPAEKADEPVRLRINTDDAKFLRSLKIAIDVES